MSTNYHIVSLWKDLMPKNDIYRALTDMLDDTPADCDILLLGAEEDVIPPSPIFRSSSASRRAIDALFKIKQDKNITIHLVTGNHLHDERMFHFTAYHHIKDLFDSVTCWPFYMWLAHTDTNLLKFSNQHPPKTTLFVCKNNRPHPHRVMLMDQFAKYNMLDNNIVTWNTELQPLDYKPLLWEPEFRRYPEYDLRTGESYEHDHMVCRDSDYMESELINYPDAVIEVVAEGSDHCLMFTEKTFKSILNKKVFLLHGCPGINEKLTDYGFKLFDNLFDYSFDSIDDVEQRAYHMVTQLVPLQDTCPEEIYRQCEHIIEHNLQCMVDILSNNTHYPDIIPACDYDDHITRTQSIIANSPEFAQYRKQQ